MASQNETSYVDNIAVTIIRSKRRRSFAVQINEGNFILRVPSRASRNSIDHSLSRFAPWIRQKHAILETAEKVPTYSFQFGEHFSWLGTKLILTRTEQRDTPKFDDNNLLVHVPKSVRNQTAYIQKSVVQFYKIVGLQHLIERIDFFADIVGARPDDVKTYSYKRRWGCCSSQRIITFNWSILLAPALVVDYVVVHELAHLIHFDHSKSYWKVVERVMPDYRSHRKWLKENGHLLSVRPNPQN